MKQNRLVNILIFVYIISCIAHPAPAFASNRNIGRIRGNAARQNERIYNKIAIDLVNNKTNNISIDNMSRLLKNYNIVEFDQGVNASTRDMIIKEIAFRMIRNYYLPTMNDRIRVYRKSAELAKQSVAYTRKNLQYPTASRGYNASLVLPVNNARIGADKTIDTLRWPEMSSQVSSAIENLWISRISSSPDGLAGDADGNSIIEVLSQLKSISEKEPKTTALQGSYLTGKNQLADAVDFIFTSWQVKGIVSLKDIPALSGLLRQYIILNSSDSLGNLARNIKSFEDIDHLHKSLIESIYNTSQNIRHHNPSDYATLAMLQAMLNDISDKISALSGKTNTPASTHIKVRN